MYIICYLESVWCTVDKHARHGRSIHRVHSEHKGGYWCIPWDSITVLHYLHNIKRLKLWSCYFFSKITF